MGNAATVSFDNNTLAYEVMNGRIQNKNENSPTVKAGEVMLEQLRRKRIKLNRQINTEIQTI